MTCTSLETGPRSYNLYQKQKSLLVSFYGARTTTSLDTAVQAKMCVACVHHSVFTAPQTTVVYEDDDSKENVHRT